MRVACPDCEGAGDLCMSCDGWGEIDIYQADHDAMRLPGTWSVEKQRARDRRKAAKAVVTEHARRRQANADERERKARERDRRDRLTREAIEQELRDTHARRERQRLEDIEFKRSQPPPRLLHTLQEAREEVARRLLLRDTGVPFEEWDQCLTLAEAVIYCKRYHERDSDHDHQQRGGTT